MNCSQQQTSNGALAATNMTTLLQKNCIKTLTVNNSVVVVGTAPVGNASAINVNANVPITGVVTPQTHMIVGQTVANTPHVQPIQAFQYHPQIQTTPQQTQYIIYNPNDVTSMFRTVATTSVTNNSLYQQSQLPTFLSNNHLQASAQHQPTIVAVTQQPQQIQSFVTQNNIPKPFSSTPSLTIASTSSMDTQQQQQPLHIQTGDRNGGNRNFIANVTTNTQPKVLNIVPTTQAVINHHQTQQQQHTSVVASLKSIENTNLKHINKIETSSSENSLGHQIIQNGTEITDNNSINNSTTTATNTDTNDINKQSNITPITNRSDSAIKNANSSHSTNVANAKEVMVKTESGRQRPEQTATPSTTVTTNTEIVEEAEEEPEIDIVINNVVCSFSVRCHLNLREIALNGRNVEFRRENGMVTMKLRRPYTTASIWSSGRITCTGATSEDQAKVGARRYARCLQALGFPVRFNNFRVVNVLGTCSMPWAIKIVNFSEKFKKDASYEPELHPGVTYKLKTPKATLKIFSTGSITVTAGSVADVQTAIEHIFPLVYEFRKKRTVEVVTQEVVYDPDIDEEFNQVADQQRANKPIKKKAIKRKYPFGLAENDPHVDNMCVSDDDDDEDIDEVDDFEDMDEDP